MRAATRCLVLTALAVLTACSGNNSGNNGDGSANGDGTDTVVNIDSSLDGSRNDGNVTPTDGTMDSADGAVVRDGSGGMDGRGGNDGGPQPPDGSTVLPDGAVILPDGAIWNPDGGNGSSDAGPQPPDGSTVLPDGAVILPDGGIWNPNTANCPAFPDGRPACGDTEVCGNGVDDNCDGLVDEHCSCQPGQSERCYDGCPTQAGMGVCTYGSMACVGSGEFGTYDGHCQGAGQPQVVQCGGLRDYKCDGVIDEGCSCMAGEMRPCYDGPASTRNVGACQDGVQTCAAMEGGTGWGPCQGEVLPTAAQCDGIDHACTGNPYADCVCVPGVTRSCYDGPTGTQDVGLCHGGMQGCMIQNGVASWGPCVGEVTPATDRCDGIDRACNGMPDMGCACAAGSQRSCYDGPAGTEGVGLCRGGVQQCMDNGSGPMWGACVGEVVPTAPQCDGLDHLCNGMPNQGCACTPGASRNCYDGPAGTEGVGVCRAGTQSCVASGTGTVWGPCSGEVLPGAIQCDGLDHACDGNYSADCPCMPGATRNCYDGPAGTAGVGTCQPGSQTCAALPGGGSQWGACAGEVTPAAPQCDGLDHACTGMPPNCNPTVMCPAPVTTSVGIGVVLRGTATAIPPATVSSYAWSVISQPAGSTFAFSSTSTNPTTFTAQSAGVYTVRMTVTDSMGRTSSCSVLVTVTSRSYLGTEFWAVTNVNAELEQGNTFDFAVAIGNPNSTAVTATVTGGALGTPLTFNIPANSTVTQPLPWVTPLSQNSGRLVNPPRNCCDSSCCTTITCSAQFTPPTSSKVTNGAYRISTTAPVSAYQFNPLQFSSTRECAAGTNSYTNDASLLLPTVALTGNYLVLGHQAFYADPAYITIAATANNTTVTVTPTAPIVASNPPNTNGVTAVAQGTPVTYNLNAGDVVELLSTRPTTLPNSPSYDPQDLTGTTIVSNNAVAVFSGVSCSFISNGGSCYACDHLEQQMFPQETWGRDVVVSQPQERPDPTNTARLWANEPYFVRILSRENNNTITFTPSTVHAAVTLQKGGFLEFCTTASFEVTSTQPILVAQFEVGQNVTSCTACAANAATSVADPSMVLEVPVQQYRRDYNFVVPSSYTANYIHVVSAPAATILLDGVPLTGPAAPITGTAWAVWRQAVMPGSHTISSTDPAGFGVKVMGVAPYTSYMYPGGLDLATLP